MKAENKLMRYDSAVTDILVILVVVLFVIFVYVLMFK